MVCSSVGLVSLGHGAGLFSGVWQVLECNLIQGRRGPVAKEGLFALHAVSSRLILLAAL